MDGLWIEGSVAVRPIGCGKGEARFGGIHRSSLRVGTYQAIWYSCEKSSALNRSCNGGRTAESSPVWRPRSRFCPSTQQVDHDIFIGLPILGDFNAPSCFNEEQFYLLSIVSSGADSHSWTLPWCPDPSGATCWNETGQTYGDNTIHVKSGLQNPPGAPSAMITVSASNVCGTVSANLPINWCEGFGQNPSDEKSNTILKEPIITSLFPNPASSMVELRLNKRFDLGESVTINVIDSRGKRIDGIVLKDHTVKIDVSEYPPGMYFLSLLTTRSISTHQTYKFIVE